ncbi:CNH domain-containing protein [Suillus subluteus]|nr:CNH domain-containing protein [Suillus subluteus]
MSAPQSNGRPPPPGDEDLQHLYDEVWRIFGEETASPTERSPTSAVSAHTHEPHSNSSFHDVNMTISPSSSIRNALNRPPVPAPQRPHSPEVRPQPDTATSPTQRRLRPLPLPPGASLSPQPHEQPPPVASTSRPGTAGVDGRRQLPQAPTVQPNGFNGSRPSTGSATSPILSTSKPVATGSHADGLPNIHKAVPAVPSHTNGASVNGADVYRLQQSDSSLDVQGYGVTVPPKPSPRPPGASAPNIPGLGNMFDDFSIDHSPDDMKNRPSHRPQQSSEHFRPADAYPQPHARLHPNDGINGPAPSARVHDLRHHPSSSSDYIPNYHQDTDPKLGRAISTGSTTSSFVADSLGRNVSVTTAATSYTDTDGSTAKVGPTILSREGSYGFPSAGPSALKYSHGHSDSGSGGFQGGSVDSLARARPSVYSGTPGPPLGDQEEEEDDDYFDSESDDPDPDRFVNFSLLSHLAVRLRDKVPRGTHVKSSIPYPRAFTGKDIVSTIQSQIQRELLINHGVSTTDRRAALQVARSLQQQLFFYEVEWGQKLLQDGVEDVYMFLDDLEGNSEAHREREELPTAVITSLTRCYASGCNEDDPCYSFACPRRQAGRIVDLGPVAEPEVHHQTEDWLSTVDPGILHTLPESEVHRQTIIYKTITQEEQYVQDLDTVEALFIRPLLKASPPVMPANKLDEFIEEVFGNILDLRECNRRLVEAMYVRQREQAPIIQRIGDVFLEAAREFRFAYPTYVGHLPLAEKRFKDEIESNADLRLFLEECSRQSKQQEARRLDLKHFLSRPSEHLQKYPIALEAIMKETTEGNPDAYYLAEAIEAIRNLQNVAQLRTFQTAMGKGPTGKWEWHDIVAKDVREGLSKAEAKRQSIIFELIKGEMAYVRDLENIELIYIQALRESDPPVVGRERLNGFITDVFHNFAELHSHHRKLLDQLHDIQRDEHPVIRSITAPLFDAALNFRDAYMEYIPNYPIAAYRIDDEMANNIDFKTFVDQCVRHPDAHRLDMKSFINRPIPRLLRYELLLKGIMDETPATHEDREAIPQVLEIIKALGKETEPGVQSAKQKVQLWCYNSNLQFKPNESVDMDLLNENRSLIHAGKLLRQPDTGFEWNGWTELFVLLFDNYLVMTKTKEKDGVTKYNVNRRPIPLDLLTLASFTDPPTQRSTSILRLGLGGGNRHVEGGPSPGSGVPDTANDSRLVYPCTIHYNGRLGGLHTLFTESQQARAEWKQKLDEAIGLRKVVQESNKVFELEPLSTDTFLVPSISSAAVPSWNHENSLTGKVTCSVPFTTADGRALVAIGCAEGVWIGFRHDSRSMRRVLHLKMVTQCAMLEDFGMFLVLADKALFAYHIEALVPSSPQSAHTSQTPQRVNGTRDVHFFSVGNQGGRTLVIYMKKKGLDSVFRVLEPVVEKINERSKAPASFTSRFGIRPARSEWFRLYREFFLPSESFDLVFLKAKIAILCTKGFEIMDLTDFKSVTIPLRDDGYERLAKRGESCRPMGMFRVENEFLLCYDEFGIYVNKHGAPSRNTGTIEWEGTAERVAIHWPYILLFDSRFIEIRHVSSGLLAQIIPGNEIRCIWDGRGTCAPPSTGPESLQQMSLDPRIHCVMAAPEPIQHGAVGRPRSVAQHVFELTPTTPLYPPGAPGSPNNSTYFQQQTVSPPQSPNLLPMTSWR